MFKNKRGYWVERVTGADGKKKTIYAHTPAELEEKLLAYAVGNARQYTFEGIAEEWWEQAQKELAIQSLASYDISMREACSFFGSKLITGITPSDVNAYIQMLSKKKLAYKTMAKRRMVLNLIFRYAVINGKCQFNPCADVRIPKGLQKTKRGCATDEDEQTVRENADVWIFYSLCFFAGLRKGEALALRPCDVDLNKGILTVRGSIAFNESGNGVYKAPKTEAGERIIPILPKLKERLLAEMPLESNSFFCTRSAIPMTKKAFVSREARERRQFGITSTPHQFRHSFATLCFERGLSPKTTQTIIGHKNLATTMDIYTDARAEQLAREAARLFDL